MSLAFAWLVVRAWNYRGPKPSPAARDKNFEEKETQVLCQDGVKLGYFLVVQTRLLTLSTT